jgi:hypothetical protein
MYTNKKTFWTAPLQLLSFLVLALAAMALSGCLGDKLDLPVPEQTPVITQQPADQSVTAGTNATFNVVAAGGVTYQWQSLVNGNWSAIPGATATSYSVSNATQGLSGTQYRVLVSAGSAVVVSSPATLTVTVVVIPPAITVQPASQTVTEPGVATFNVTATGSAPLTYLWRRRDGTTYTTVAGATGATYVTPPTARASDNGAGFFVIVSNSAGSATSLEVTLTVDPAPLAPAFTTHPVSVAVTEPATATFSVAVTGTPTPTLQWQYSSNGGFDWFDIGNGPGDGTGATTTTYTTPPTTTAMSPRVYRAVATNSAGSIFSNPGWLVVDVAPVAPSITLQPTDTSVYEPARASFSIVVSGVPTPTIQWQRSDDAGSSWSNIVGANSATYMTPATIVGPDDDARFRAVVQNVAGTATSDQAVLTVLTMVAPVITTHPVLQEVVGSGEVTFTAAASGSPAPALQWQVSHNGGTTWLDIGSASSPSYSIYPIRALDGSEFRVMAYNDAGVAFSNPARFNNIATMTVLTSINAANGGASTPSFQRFNGSGLDNAGNFVFVYGNQENSGIDVVRTIVPTTGAVSDRATISTGVAANGVAFDPTGNMYIANYDRVRRVDTNGVQSNFVSGFNRLFGGMVYLGGSLYTTNDAYCVVHGITVPGATDSVVAGLAGNCSVPADGTGPAARFISPTGITRDYSSGHLFVCDNNGSRLVRLTAAGAVTTLSSSGVGSAFGDPTRLIACDWLTSDEDGNLYFLGGATVYKRNWNGITSIVGRLPHSTETRILQWSPAGFLAVGNGGNLLRLDLR